MNNKKTIKRIIFALLLILIICVSYFIFRPKETDFSGIFVKGWPRAEIAALSADTV